MKVKVSELTGTALDWAVAKCEGYVEEGVYGEPKIIDGCLHLHYCDVVLSSDFKPTTDWRDGGPIIERENISPRSCGDGSWVADWYFGDEMCAGPSPLIAAMRCYVASKLGNEVEIPKELT